MNGPCVSIRDEEFEVEISKSQYKQFYCELTNVLLFLFRDDGEACESFKEEMVSLSYYKTTWLYRT